MSDFETHAPSSPETAAEILRDSNAVLLASSNQAVTLAFAEGYFVLGWSAKNIDSYDWVALYRSINDPDASYLTYQWAVNGNSYVTSEIVQAGYQARYLIWNATTKEYNSVARTDPFPVMRVCSE